MLAGSSSGLRTLAVVRHSRLRGLVAGLLVAMCVAIAPPASPPVARAGDIPGGCLYSSDPMARATDLMANRYLLEPHPIVTLPSDPTWAESPLGDVNWEYQFHTLRYTMDLLWAWRTTSAGEYLDRALFLLEDWYRENPRSDPPSSYSWNDHSTAWRAVTYACAASLIPMTDWLQEALALHGTTLADPDFYVRYGNHALNQSLGLLEVGFVLGRDDWMTLAQERINALLPASVDSQGVTNEQSVGYQAYNYRQYLRAKERLLALGLTPGTAFELLDLMPGFLGTATLPDGYGETIGDTDSSRMASVPGTWTEFMATQGASGPTPPLVAAYRAGYLFAHSGWGAKRAFRDETFLSLRWGPGRKFHGHPDGTSLTLYAWGSRLIVDPGRFTYAANKWRTFARSRAAHNVVTVDGRTWDKSAPTKLVGRKTTSGFVDVRLSTQGYSGVTQRRRVTWSRELDYLIIEDRLTSSTRRTYRQLWHLVQGSNVAVGTTTVRTRRATGNVLIRQLVGSPTIRVVKGATNPVQGWISYRYGRWTAAPVVQAIRAGTNVRYLTLIVPAQGRPRAQTSGLKLTPDGYRVTVTINGRSERVVASGAYISVTPVAGS